MGRAQWGAEPEFFGPRHRFRETLIVTELGGGPPEALHLECAAGVGSLTLELARRGRRVVAADRSLRSLAVLHARAARAGLRSRVIPVAADITALPFPDGTFPSATTAETLEHVPDDARAVSELARVLCPGGRLAGTVPADPRQWSAWDDWAGHLRRYTREDLGRLLAGAGLRPRVRVWGWPLVRVYDALFLRRVNRRRLHTDRPIEADPTLRRVQRLGRARWLVRAVTAVFALDRLVLGAPWGVGLVFSATREGGPAEPTTGPSASAPGRR